jgi:hypothetical protein
MQVYCTLIFYDDFFVKDEISCLVAVKNLSLIVLEEIRPDKGLE